MINLQQIDFGYQRNKLLFHNLTLEAETGSIYGLLGKNGAGKTSLLKIIAGLRKIQEGSATVLGTDPFDRKLECLEQFYFVPEELYLPSSPIKRYVKQYARFYPNFNKGAF